VRDAGGGAEASALDATALLEGGTTDAMAAGESGGSTVCGGSVLGGGPTTPTPTHLDIEVHDPSMIWDGTRYSLFATGGTLNVRRSADILTWTDAGNLFGAIPAWVSTALGSAPTDLWGPDISYFNGQFHVYYAGSSFGSNDSVIGLATTPSLASPTWADQGLVLQSRTSDDFNAIDPNVSFDASCTPWLAFGSFWSGIKMRKLDGTTGKPDPGDTTPYSLASRNGGAIEAASIVSHNGYYYLFVSFDLCCQGVDSTYRTMVGRGTSITGPYTDKAGTSMMQGAAEQLLATSGRYIGPGGGTAWKDGSTYLYVYHYYDGDDDGVSKLQIRPITFDSSNWVVLGAPLFP
jgi:arabinan endo-1,5-alpha-L-arabinosidase